MDIRVPREVLKPWGSEAIWAEVEGKYLGKFLYVDANQSLSLQYHNIKDETMMLIAGKAILELDGVEHHMVQGISYHITPGTRHRLTAITYAKIVEVSTFHPNDVIRLKDNYGRS